MRNAFVDCICGWAGLVAEVPYGILDGKRVCPRCEQDVPRCRNGRELAEAVRQEAARFLLRHVDAHYDAARDAIVVTFIVPVDDKEEVHLEKMWDTHTLQRDVPLGASVMLAELEHIQEQLRSETRTWRFTKWSNR